MERTGAITLFELFKQYGSDPMELYRNTGLIIPVSGGAKGYNETKDIPFTTIDGYDLGALYDEINETLSILNSQRNPLLERLSFPVTTPIESVPQIIGDEFEEADEFGQPKGIRLGDRWNLGFDLRYFDLGIRYTWRFLGESTADQVRALNNSALEADQRLVFKTVFEQLFRNTKKSHTLRGGTAVDVYPFYNGDVETLPVAPPKWKTYSHATSHTHYLVSGGATVVSGDLDDMETHIHHHGYTQGAELILLVNRAQMQVIAKFRVASGDRYDFIPKAGISFYGQVTGPLASDQSGLNVYPGFQGKYGNINIVEEDYIQPAYMFLFASGGRFAERNPIGLREHENPAMKGLKIIGQHQHYPLIDSFYHHALGSGVRHRGAGVVMQVKASGSYDIPATETQGPGGR